MPIASSLLKKPRLVKKLKEFYDHTELGVYLIPLEDGEVSIEDKIII